MIKNKNKSLVKPLPSRKKESIEQNSSLRQPPPPKKTESVKHYEQNSLLNTMKDGFSFGIGSSMGHMIVNRIFSDKKETNISNINDKNISENKLFTDNNDKNISVNKVFTDNNDKNISVNKVFTDNNVEIINNTEILFKKYNECIENNKKDNDINECLKILEKNKIDF